MEAGMGAAYAQLFGKDVEPGNHLRHDVWHVSPPQRNIMLS